MGVSTQVLSTMYNPETDDEDTSRTPSPSLMMDGAGHLAPQHDRRTCC